MSLPPIPARDPAANDAVCATDYCGHQMRYHWTSDWACTQCSCGRWRKAES